MNRLRRCWTLGLSIFLLAGAVSGQAEGGLVRSDFDHDCDVDAVDFAHFKSCALRSTVPQSNPLCADARLDADADVDMDDFGIFQRCYSGEGNVANPACDPMCLGPDCNCPCGQTTCNGTCVNTRSDNGNCGACGNVCDTSLTCQNGTCAPCPDGLTDCEGVCTNTAFDTQNCGACGHACSAGDTCSGGTCQSPW